MKNLWFMAVLFITACAVAHPGVGIVMDSHGNVFYTDLKQVWKIDKQGNKSVVVRNVHTHELYVDEHNNLYGEHLWYNGERLNTWGHFVWKYTADGRFEKIIPDAEGFLTNYSFVRDRQGNMFWADRKNTCQKVARRNTDGSITQLGDQCLNNIRWMSVSRSGTIFLVDLNTIKKIDARGKIKILATEHGKHSQLMGLSTDHQENVYVADYGERKVKKITPAGQVFTAAETGFNWPPTGVLSAPNGDLWILECSPSNAVRVERIMAGGKRIIY